MELDQIILALQSTPGFHVRVVDSEGQVRDWFPVDSSVYQALVIQAGHLETQIAANAAQLAHWGRILASAERVLDVREREFTSWKATQMVKHLSPPKDAGDWKKPSEKMAESLYRSDPEYAQYGRRIEESREAARSSELVVEGLRAQRHMLETMAKRRLDDATPYYVQTQGGNR